MRKLKARFFIQQYRKFIFIIIVVAVIGSIMFSLSKINGKVFIENPTLFGVIGTLAGAIIGGFFSLMGSVWVNSNQQRATKNIKRKNVIYSPLYDELVDIQDRILVEIPYPDYIVFQKGTQTMTPHPQFTAWGRIKMDTRYLEVPNTLINQMERLECAIREYKDIRTKANDEMQNILNRILIKNGLNKCPIINIGSVISSDILGDKKTDLYHQVMGFGEEKQIDNRIREVVNQQIYEDCNNNLVIIKTRKYYENWLMIQKETIEMLGLLIKQVLVMYEGG